MNATIEVESTPLDRVVLRATFPDWTVASIHDHLTKPELLVRWWPQAAETDVREGGAYHLSWPSMDWHLRGSYSALESGKRIAFTWRWDHEPDLPTRTVEIRLHELEGGAELELTHGTYGDTPGEQEDRQSHIDGWTHFLGQLQRLVPDTKS